MLFPKDKINKDARYYALELSADDRGHMSIGGQTIWVGWADEEMRVELREATRVIPDRMADFWTDFGMPFSVVNTVDDFARWYFSGGHALVKTTIAKDLLPDAVNPAPCVKTGNHGFTVFNEIPKTLFRPAPTPKLRMAILKRDDYRCRVCGRRPEKHVDIELHVHHIRPAGQRGATHEDNLITLCDTCHRGLDPHYEWSLYGLLEDRATDVKTHERQKYLRGVEAYRESMRNFFAERSHDA